MLSYLVLIIGCYTFTRMFEVLFDHLIEDTNDIKSTELTLVILSIGSALIIAACTIGAIVQGNAVSESFNNL